MLRKFRTRSDPRIDKSKMTAMSVPPLVSVTSAMSWMAMLSIIALHWDVLDVWCSWPPLWPWWPWYYCSLSMKSMMAVDDMGSTLGSLWPWWLWPLWCSLFLRMANLIKYLQVKKLSFHCILFSRKYRKTILTVPYLSYTCVNTSLPLKKIMVQFFYF
jgi:hypothetical protein